MHVSIYICMCIYLYVYSYIFYRNNILICKYRCFIYIILSNKIASF